jgi:hypothetical protein
MCVFRINNSCVRSVRKRRGFLNLPCKEAGIHGYSLFAKTIDPRIKKEYITCPPGNHPDKYWCAWEFTITK